MLCIWLDTEKANKAFTWEEAKQAFGQTDMQKLMREGLLVTRNDWRDFATVERIANELNAAYAARGERKTFVATDDGPNVSPRFDVCEVPALGDLCSYAFNGDYYPCGKVTKVSATMRRIEATDEAGSVKVFYRRKETGCWKMAGGTWSLVAGHRRELNPSF